MLAFSLVVEENVPEALLLWGLKDATAGVWLVFALAVDTGAGKI